MSNSEATSTLLRLDPTIYPKQGLRKSKFCIQMAFNQNTRVKIPAILHLCRLGYEYLSLKGVKWVRKIIDG